MTRQENYDIWAAYCEMANRPRVFSKKELRENLEKERAMRKEAAREQYGLGRIMEAESKLNDVAMAACKTKTGWREVDADDIRRGTRGAMLHRQPDELKERYTNKAVIAYHAENWYEKQIDDCEKRIAALMSELASPAQKNTKRQTEKSINNKLMHWRKRMIDLEIGMAKRLRQTERYERLAMKWRGIMARIEEAEIAREIWLERHGGGNDNKYGFNPKGQSRDDAEIMFTD